MITRPDSTFDEIVKKLYTLDLFDATGSSLLVVDKDLHVLYYNRKQIDNPDKAFNSPGDLLRCCNAQESSAGCGTHPNCATCLLRGGIKSSMSRMTPSTVTSSFLVDDNKAIEVKAVITPFCCLNEVFAATMLIDVTAQHKEMMMEQVFFHDMLNISSALENFIQMMDKDSLPEVMPTVRELSTNLIHKLTTQRDLIYAEKGLLKSNMESILLRDMADRLFSSLQPKVQSRGILLERMSNVGAELIHSDSRLILHILQDMVLNACEASEAGSVIRVSVMVEGDRVVFGVNNPVVMSPTVQAGIFRYGSTTKEPGHGIGTYSMKVYGENYLGGKVWFTSCEPEGTTFYLSLPIV